MLVHGRAAAALVCQRGSWQNRPMTPSDVALQHALALRDGGDLAAAIDTLRAAASLDLAHAELAVNLAKMLSESGQFDKAEQWFRHALKLVPDDLDLRLAYGTFLGQTGQAAIARDYLLGVMKDLEAALDQASMLGDRDAILEVNRFLGAASVNIGRAALECGDAAMAISFARGWLDDPECGEAAQALIADAIDSDDLDPQRIAELSLDGGRVTPAVVTLLIDTALGREPPDLVAVERAVAAADEALDPDWQHSDEALTRVLGIARAQLGRAVMRGGLDANDFPALSAVGR